MDSDWSDAMSAVEESPGMELSASGITDWLRVAGGLLRIVFIIALVVVTLRVSMPQSQSIWTAYETPADLIRMVSGYAVSIGLVIQLFKMPKDAASHRAWLYLGLAAVPFALICLFAIW
jgi:hypothetical protein